MEADLPEGVRSRRPTTDDAEAIFTLVAAHNTSAIGFADFALDDAHDHLTGPGFDPSVDGWIVERDRLAVGYGWACRNGDSDIVDIDVTALDDQVAAWLFARVLTRAGQIAVETGHEQAHVDMWIYRADEAQRARAAALGFAPATTFHRMRIDHDGTVSDSLAPDGVVLHPGPGDERLRRDAHAVLTSSFADHFGFVRRSYEEWHDRIESSATGDWSQLRVAYVDGEPAAMLLGSDLFVGDEGCGYINNVGVMANARDRGLAKLLLRQAFAGDVRRARKGTLLHVDTNNPTPALGLYLSVGMRVVLVADVWRRAVSVV